MPAHLVSANPAVLPAVKDSANIVVLSPSKEKEQAVFSDSKLKYKGTIKEAPGFFESLLSWLAMKLFGKAGVDNILFTRRLIIWLVVIISVYIIIRLLMRTELAGLTKQKAKGTAFNFTDLTEDLDSVNFKQRIQAALNDNDYRLAIRWQYLQLLFLLDKQQLIAFAPHKTNIDYRYELKDKNLQENFTALSRIYEYAWYGRFVITESTYAANAETFSELEKQLHVQGK